MSALSASSTTSVSEPSSSWPIADFDPRGVGKRADLTAFAVDPLLAPPDELVEAPIVLTVADGLITHGTLVGAAWS